MHTEYCYDDSAIYTTSRPVVYFFRLNPSVTHELDKEEAGLGFDEESPVNGNGNPPPLPPVPSLTSDDKVDFGAMLGRGPQLNPDGPEPEGEAVDRAPAPVGLGAFLSWTAFV